MPPPYQLYSAESSSAESTVDDVAALVVVDGRGSARRATLSCLSTRERASAGEACRGDGRGGHTAVALLPIKQRCDPGSVVDIGWASPAAPGGAACSSRSHASRGMLASR